MAHFYGVLKGARGEATRCTTKKSGLKVTAASWRGAVSVYLYHDATTGEDRYEVNMRPWHGSGESVDLASGIVGKGAA